MSKKILQRVLAFALMAAVMGGLAFFRNENDNDKHYFRAKLARGQELHCRIDLGKEGELKYLLQPNIYTLYLRLLPEDKQVQLRRACSCCCRAAARKACGASCSLMRC